MKKIALHWQILLGMILGVLFGLLMTQFIEGKEIVQNWVKPFGSIFINALKLIAVPLILASLIKGVSDLKDISKLSIDSLSMIINSTNLDFKTSELTFNKMNNLGITSLSNNDSLNLKITEYYNGDMVRLKLGINYIFNDLIKRTDFYLYEQNKIDIMSNYSNQKFPSLYNQSEEELEKEFKTNTIGFIQSIKGRNIVIYNLGGKKYSLSLLNGFKQKTTTLLKAIYDELKIYDPKIKSLPTLPSEVE